jgi:hypothetical protein
MTQSTDSYFSEMWLQWQLSLDRVQNIHEYDELNKEYSKIKSKVSTNHVITDEDDIAFFKVIKTQWKWIIRDGANEILNKIENRKTKGQNFREIIREVEKVKISGQEDASLDIYESLYSKLKIFDEDTKEKIDIEKFESKQFWTT